MEQDHFAIACASERPRLVRLCALLTGHPEAAEDLAQDTLLEAWRSADTLRDEDKLAPWLSGVARNVCRRWLQRQHLSVTTTGGTNEEPASEDDLEIQLERDELAILLDRALALLPAATRDVLIARFIEELPHAEIAARLGLSEGAVAVRVHRGKVALGRLLAGPELRSEAEAFGIVTSVDDWEQTRIICPFCGQHPLLLRRRDEAGELWYRCAGACIPTGTILSGLQAAESFRALRSPKSILTRQLTALNDRYRLMLDAGESRCDACGRPLPVDRSLPDDWPVDAGPGFGLQVRCPTCGVRDSASMWHLALDTPEAQRFWRRHPRMRALPVTGLEFDGRPALRTGFISRGDTARLDVIAERGTYEILRIDGKVTQ